MKIVFTGGGTGGHFYPIIAIVQKVNQIIDQENIIGAKLYYVSDSPYDKEILFEHGLIYEEVMAGKMRTYFSLRNFVDIFKMLFGSIGALYKIFSIYPDVVFGKGGYASFPVLLAARILRIPIIIHESDSVPGRVNKWAGKFADKVAVSFKEAAEYFPENKVAWTGHPLRVEIENVAPRIEALKYFKFESDIPVLLVLGGSLGSLIINNTILDALPRLVKNFQIIHQTGVKNYKNVSSRGEVVLSKMPEKSRYICKPFLNPLEMKMASGVANIIVSRAGSTIFEIASWGIPSIIVPISNSNGDHQRRNAFSYAHTGGCIVVEEMNMTGNILSSEIERITGDQDIMQSMSKNAKAFHKHDASMKIAKVLVDTALSHEK